MKWVRARSQWNDGSQWEPEWNRKWLLAWKCRLLTWHDSVCGRGGWDAQTRVKNVLQPVSGSLHCAEQSQDTRAPRFLPDPPPRAGVLLRLLGTGLPDFEDSLSWLLGACLGWAVLPPCLFLSAPPALESRGQPRGLAASSRCTLLSPVEAASWAAGPAPFRQLWSPVASVSDPTSSVLDDTFEQFLLHPFLWGITEDFC